MHRTEEAFLDLLDARLPKVTVDDSVRGLCLKRNDGRYRKTYPLFAIRVHLAIAIGVRFPTVEKFGALLKRCLGY